MLRRLGRAVKRSGYSPGCSPSLKNPSLPVHALTIEVPTWPGITTETPTCGLTPSDLYSRADATEACDPARLVVRRVNPFVAR
jgi:hypothetical protein